MSSDSFNHVTASLRFGLNITGKFKGTGTGFNLYPNDPTTTPDGNPYNYGDGYVYPSAIPGSSGLTWNWGYDSQSQVDTVNKTISLSQTSASPSDQSTDVDQNPGFEITYDRQLGVKEDWHHMRYGVEGAFNYMPISFSVNGTYSENLTTYLYQYGANLPPPGYNQPALLPYQGTYDGPGFIIRSSPVGSLPSAPIPGATLSVQDKFSADMWGFRLGPYVEFPFNNQFNLRLSGGLAVGLLNSSANWSETFSLNGSHQTLSGGGNNFSALCGGYFSLAADYQIDRNWDIGAGVQFQDLGTYNHNYGGRGMELDLSQSVYLEVGVSYRF